MDQAGTLRRLSRNLMESDQKVICAGAGLRGLAVASGKGGVGKTNTVANIAYTLAQMGKRALVLDADMGLGNIHILMGLAPRLTLMHVISGERTMDEVLIKTDYGFDVLPAGSGSRKHNDLTGEELLALKTELEVIENDYDFVLFDIGAGISGNVMYFCSAVNDVALITSAEPTSFADAYAVMKVLSKNYGKREFKLIVNSVRNRAEAYSVYNRLEQVSDRFGLNIHIEFMGHIEHDKAVPASVRRQSLFAKLYPDCRATACVRDIANGLVEALTPGEIVWGRIFS